MTPCVCGCPMHGGTCPHCGCSIYEPDNDDPAPPRSAHPLRAHQLYTGRYARNYHR